jgi:hypothetical protein
VAVTLAGALVRIGRRVCLVDLTTSGGHVGLNLRLPAPTTWANLPAAPDSTSMAQLLLKHDSGLLVLAAPPQPVRLGPPAATFRATLDALQIFFTDVIVDAGRLTTPRTALGITQRILVWWDARCVRSGTAAGLCGFADRCRPAARELVQPCVARPCGCRPPRGNRPGHPRTW